MDRPTCWLDEINVDGHMQREILGFVCTGGAMRNLNAILIEGFYKNIGIASNNREEDIVPWQDIKYLKELNLDHIILEGYYKIIIHYLKRIVGFRWYFLSIFQDCIRILSTIKHVRIHHTSREGNIDADIMANLGLEIITTSTL